MFFQKIVLGSFKSLKRGSLEILLPGGECHVFGGLHKGLHALIAVKDARFFRRCVLFGPIGFAEAYMAGEWETPDLTRVIAWFILNAEDANGMETRTGRSTGVFNLLNHYNRYLHLRRPNSLSTSRANIREHYD